MNEDQIAKLHNQAFLAEVHATLLDIAVALSTDDVMARDEVADIVLDLAKKVWTNMGTK